jgi:hypothetical protein
MRFILSILLVFSFCAQSRAAYTEASKVVQETDWVVDNDIADQVRNSAANHTQANISSSWMKYRRVGKMLVVSFAINFSAAFGTAGSPIFVKLPLMYGSQLYYDTTYYTNGAATTFREAPTFGKGDWFDGSGPVTINWYPDLAAVAGNMHVRAVNAGGSSYVDTNAIANRALRAHNIEIPIVGW